MEKDAKIYVAGHTGLVGSAIVRQLEAKGYRHIITRTADELDLTRQQAVESFFDEQKPQYVFVAAAKVGGIWANNTRRADFIYINLAIETNLIHTAFFNQVSKLLFLGSSCIYPKHCPQPMKETHLLSDYLEPTNEPYAIAKIAGIKMCESYNRQHGTNFISAMPTNLYGPRDNFDLKSSHVLPALMRKFHTAKVANENEVVVWGTGKPRREFLFVDDLAGACVFLMNHYNGEKIVNVGVGEDITIEDLAELVAQVVGFKGKLLYDTSKPDGAAQKLLDVSRINALGWKAKTSLKEGIEKTYQWYLKNVANDL
jgi:GDP-L-fucose synthase